MPYARRVSLAVAFAVAVSIPVAFANAASLTPADGGAFSPAADPEAASAADGQMSLAQSRARVRPAAQIATIRAGGAVALLDEPAGRRVGELGATTEFGSAQALGVVRTQGRWLGVTTAALPNGRLGWIDGGDEDVSISRTRWSIRADVSQRRIELRRDGRTVHSLGVAVGRPGSPTPTGRFAVTDKLAGADYGAYYGCCILALSATQPNTPAGWQGGNRMAIHGTSDPGSIGSPVSAGCLRAGDEDLRVLMDRVPVGTPVTIRP